MSLLLVSLLYGLIVAILNQFNITLGLVPTIIIYAVLLLIVRLITNAYEVKHPPKKPKKCRHDQIRDNVCIAMFCALAYIVSFCFPIKVQFLTFDAKDAIIAIGGMFFGPVAALNMSILVPLLEFLSFSDTGIYGFIMNFLSSAAFSVTASLIYKYRRRISGAIIGLATAVLAMTAVMMVANLFITPLYVSMPRETVAEMIPTLLLPFNLTKAVLNSGLVLLLYKPFTTALRAAKLVPKGNSAKTSPLVTAFCAIAAVALLMGAILIYIIVLKGSFSFFGK